MAQSQLVAKLFGFWMASKSYVLCISTSFWALSAHKSWPNYFFPAVFNLFCSFKTFFSDFTAEINRNVGKWTKKKLEKSSVTSFWVLTENVQNLVQYLNDWHPKWPFFGYHLNTSPKVSKMAFIMSKIPVFVCSNHLNTGHKFVRYSEPVYFTSPLDLATILWTCIKINKRVSKHDSALFDELVR